MEIYAFVYFLDHHNLKIVLIVPQVITQNLSSRATVQSEPNISTLVLLGRKVPLKAFLMGLLLLVPISSMKLLNDDS